MEEIDLSSVTNMNAFLFKIKENLNSQVSGVWHIDTSLVGIYKKPTIYIWIYRDTETEVISEIQKLYPKLFYIFDHKRSINVEEYKNNIVVKINKTDALRIFPEEKKSRRCTIM